jgi:hypothetical protein
MFFKCGESLSLPRSWGLETPPIMGLAVEKGAGDLGFIARSGLNAFADRLGAQLLARGDSIQRTDRVGWIIDLARAAR